jgi:uridine kinase
MSDSKSKLIVFAGKPGVGKTTIIQRLFKNATIVDVQTFVMVHVDEFPIVPKEKNIFGYKTMYKHIATLKKPVVVVEIGTSHPGFNIRQLEKLQNRYKISLFLCDASVETCRIRSLARKLNFDGKWIESRLQRNFPGSFLNILKDTNLDYKIINTEGNLKKVVKNINILK